MLVCDACSSVLTARSAGGKSLTYQVPALCLDVRLVHLYYRVMVVDFQEGVDFGYITFDIFDERSSRPPVSTWSSCC